MAICALSFQEFDRFNAVRATVARHLDTAVEWFANEEQDVLGAIAYHHRDLDWSWVVLRRDHRGEFCALARAGALRVLDDARQRLLETMSRATGDEAVPSLSASSDDKRTNEGTLPDHVDRPA
jgi:hypothetical protein